MSPKQFNEPVAEQLNNTDNHKRHILSNHESDISSNQFHQVQNDLEKVRKEIEKLEKEMKEINSIWEKNIFKPWVINGEFYDVKNDHFLISKNFE